MKKRLKLNRETVRLVGTEKLKKIAGETCWDTIAAPCGDDNQDSSQGCVSGNLC